MGRHGFHWLSMAALGVAILVSGRLQLGHRASGAALALEAAHVPMRGLTSDEVRGLQEGEEMGMARAAELNGYPGPASVLEAAQKGKLDLYADQRQAIERIQAAAKAGAQSLGRELLAQEATLEAAFRSGHMVEADLTRQVEDIGRKLAALRLIHLRAHLLTVELLRPRQIEEYYQYRGLATPSSGHALGY